MAIAYGPRPDSTLKTFAEFHRHLADLGIIWKASSMHDYNFWAFMKPFSAPTVPLSLFM
ncbi:unnamed protein product [Dovyalis caffra]|uniref:Uncharacterized protein n=1 Tax=Dovyalis caffra TaxID=77055 RepID=A0AAV1QRZ7_9ROSI|nr:unnamed protein product [Dovyalis caffra]